MSIGIVARRLRGADHNSNDLGWGLFEADGSILNANGDRPYQLQRVDFPEDAAGDLLPPRFADDSAAHRHVVAEAWGGCPLARLTLRYLRRFSAPEYREIMEASHD